MAILVDTSFLLAKIFSSDEKHKRANELADRLGHERLLLTDHVFDEVVTYISKKQNNQAGFLIGMRLLDSDQTELLVSTEEDIRGALELLKHHNGFSFTDALSAYIMEKEGVERIVSFDSDFDQVKGIERVC